MNTAVAMRPATKPRQTSGLEYWMERVLEECDRASIDFAADPVHDLRVAIRRCRSLADGLMVIDPDKSWKQMKKAVKPLFQALGELRDTQVMEEVAQSLGPSEDPVVKCILDYSKLREQDLKGKAQAALEDFDRKTWRSWAKQLPRQASRIRQGSTVFRHMALERWTEGRELQRQAFRNRSQVALHRLRIGLKRLRYTVENFLPELHDAWIGDLKSLQDKLGEIHDLDVLWAKMVELRAFPDEEAQQHWRQIMTDARNQRIEQYREMMLGKDSLWSVWRAQLPKGDEVRRAGLERLRLWASFLDPDVRHSRNVASLALKLYNGLGAMDPVSAPGDDRARDVLHAAALLHEVGREKSDRNHHKASAKRVARLAAPLGWSAEDMALVALVARYHRGALPRTGRREFSTLALAQQKTAMHLAAVLRLADAFDSDRSGSIQDVHVLPKDGFLSVCARGYSARSRIAEHIAGARHLLELVYGRPVMVRGLR